MRQNELKGRNEMRKSFLFVTIRRLYFNLLMHELYSVCALINLIQVHAMVNDRLVIELQWNQSMDGHTKMVRTFRNIKSVLNNEINSCPNVAVWR